MPIPPWRQGDPVPKRLLGPGVLHTSLAVVEAELVPATDTEFADWMAEVVAFARRYGLALPAADLAKVAADYRQAMADVPAAYLWDALATFAVYGRFDQAMPPPSAMAAGVSTTLLQWRAERTRLLAAMAQVDHAKLHDPTADRAAGRAGAP